MKLFRFFRKNKKTNKFNHKNKTIININTENSNINLKKYQITPKQIISLLPNEIFVFGSNLAGNHNGGAARTALNKFGAIYGQGIGLQGQSYAIPTMQGEVDTIIPYINDFIDFAKKNKDFFFLLQE